MITFNILQIFEPLISLCTLYISMNHTYEMWREKFKQIVFQRIKSLVWGNMIFFLIRVHWDNQFLEMDNLSCDNKINNENCKFSVSEYYTLHNVVRDVREIEMIL